MTLKCIPLLQQVSRRRIYPALVTFRLVTNFMFDLSAIHRPERRNRHDGQNPWQFHGHTDGHLPCADIGCSDVNW